MDRDDDLMREALRLARLGADAGEVPVGAVAVLRGEIVAGAFNSPISRNDPTAHAEILVLRQAAERIGNYRLEGVTIYCTLEPCAMCAGALVHARIQRLIYGADDPKAGAVQSVIRVLNHPQLNHKIEVRSGVLAGRSAEVLQSFFKSRR